MGIKERYTKLILSNAESVAQIEGILRTALYLVPGRFRNSELKAELGMKKERGKRKSRRKMRGMREREINREESKGEVGRKWKTVQILLCT
jgi:hypothetical protein